LTRTITSWSFSRYNKYAKCPAAAKYEILDRLPQPGSPAMERGSTIHDAARAYIAGEVKERDPHLGRFGDLFNGLRQRHGDSVVVEDSWAFRKDWTVTTYDDWDQCWLRIKVDAATLIDNKLSILDWKTGKFSPQWNVTEYEQQLELYCLGGLLMFSAMVPDLEVSATLVYLDAGITYPDTPKVYTAKDLPRLKREWYGRTLPMLSDTLFAPNPGRGCGWCAFSSAKGGPCAH